MVQPAERGQGQYDVERALHYHERITQVLRTKAAAGELRLVTDAPVLGLGVFVLEPTLIVAPTKPIYTASELDRFRRGLLPGITPDFQLTSTGSYLDKHGGLSFGSMSFNNVPGFTLHQGKVIQDSASANSYTLESLSSKTGKPKTELVKRTWIHVFPEATLAEFMFDYAQGLKDGRYPHSPVLADVASGLSERRLKALQENPKKLIDWLKAQIEVARDYKKRGWDMGNLWLTEI